MVNELVVMICAAFVQDAGISICTLIEASISNGMGPCDIIICVGELITTSLIVKAELTVVFQYDPPSIALIIANHACGYILNLVMKNGYAETAKISAQRALKSNDVRVRLMAAKSGPLKVANRLRFDSNATVRRAAIKRIGINYCYMDHLNDPAIDIKTQALMVAPLSDFDYAKVIEEVNMEMNDGKLKKWRISWYYNNIISSIFSKMDAEEALFYLEMGNDNINVNEVLKYKINA
jgi:hypothetical protein